MKFVPNALSIFRFLCAFAILYLTTSGKWMAALVIMVLGYSSDLIDGALARRYHLETNFGKVMDLIADVSIDLGVIGGLLMTGYGHFWWAGLVALSAITLRLQVFEFFKKFQRSALIISPAWSIGMIYFAAIYITRAIGMRGFLYLLVLAAVVVPIIIWLKRERFVRDMAALKNAFFGAKL